jgi:hypothetical protein
MFETQQNRSFSGFGAVVACTANFNAAQKLNADWGALWDEALRYPKLTKSVKDALWTTFQSAVQWYDDGFGSGVWCRTKEDLAARQAELQRAIGALAVATTGLQRVELVVSDPSKAVTLPEENITGHANWWGLTFGVLAISVAAIVARRRRAGLGGVRAFRHRYRKGARR